MSTPVRLRPVALISLCSFLLLAACAGHVAVDGRWQQGAARADRYARILVVGLSPDYNSRCAFEWSMADSLKSATTDAMPSCSRLKENDSLTRENIVKVVADTGADAVLTTVLVERSYKTQEGGGRDTRGTANYKATGTDFGYAYNPGYGAYGVPVNIIYGEFVTTPPITSLNSKVSVASTVYEAKEGAAVYSMTIRAGDVHARDSALAAITPAIAGRLRKDGVTR